MKTFASVIIGLTLFACIESASAQTVLPSSWRGRYVRRDGLFRVERIKWGNGITPVGGQVLIAGINAAEEVVTSGALESLIKARVDSELRKRKIEDLTEKNTALKVRSDKLDNRVRQLNRENEDRQRKAQIQQAVEAGIKEGIRKERSRSRSRSGNDAQDAIREIKDALQKAIEAIETLEDN